jgi:hypothetical protein
MEPYTRSGSVKVRSWGSKPFGELSPRRDFFEVLHYSRNHDNLVDLHLRHFDPGYAVLPRPLELEALGGEGDPSRLLPRPDLYHDQLHWRDVVGEVEPIGKRKPGPFSSKSSRLLQMPIWWVVFGLMPTERNVGRQFGASSSLFKRSITTPVPASVGFRAEPRLAPALESGDLNQMH